MGKGPGLKCEFSDETVSRSKKIMRSHRELGTQFTIVRVPIGG